MAYIDPKRDYKDGEILYGIDLDASNEVIKAGVDDNFNRIKGLQSNKQDILQSGVNIKTINGEDILGEGNLIVEGTGTPDYEELYNQPKINNVTLVGDKSLSDLGIDIPTKISDLNNDNNTVTDANYVHTDSNYTSEEKTKLASVEEGAQANVTEVVVDDTPTSDTKILIDSYDISPSSSASEITNQSSESTTLGYSCAYTNNNFLGKNDTTFPNGIILANTSFLKGIDGNNTQINLIRAVDNRTAVGDSSKETRIWSSVIPTISVDGVIKTLATTADLTDINNFGKTGTGYFDGTNTSINTLNTNGKWRGYIQPSSDDKNYLGFSGNVLVETFVQANSNGCIQRITHYSSGRQKIRYCSTNAFSYNDFLYEPYMLKSGGVFTGNIDIGDSSDTSNRSVAVINSYHQGEILSTTNSNFGLYDLTNDKWIVKSDSNGDVTLSGNADTATKLGTADKGNTNTPIYLDEGVPTEGNEYVPKTGGTYTGNLIVDKGNNDTDITVGSTSYKKTNQIRTKNNTIDVGIGTDGSGAFRIWDYTHSKEILKCTSAGVITFNGNEYVPKTGGTFSGNLTIDRANGTGGTGSDNEGFSYLNIGNTKAKTEAGNTTGRLELYNDSGKRARLYFASGASSNRDIYFPNTAGQVTVTSGSSRRIKENIKDMTEEEAKKILDINVIDFDYKKDFGGEKGCHGVIAEDLNKIIPYAVTINDNYDENKEPDYETNTPPMVNYEKLIPHLIKMIQIQEKRIKELESK